MSITTARSRRLVLAASVVVLTLSACGDPSASTSSTISSSASPAVIHVGAAGGRAAGVAETAMADSKMMAPINFVFAGDAPDLTSPAASWYFAPNPTISDDALKAIAAALGVTGEVTMLPADQGGGRVIGSTDYTKPSVTLGTDATGSWWFNAGNSAASVSVGCAMPEQIDPATSTVVGGDAVVDPAPCSTPQPPANVPTKDEATTKATEFLTSIGLDPSQYVLDVYADEWGANVTASLVLDGARTTMSTSIGYGENGAITWASGFLATPQRGDDYPRIGVMAAVARMGDQWGMGWRGYGGGPVMMASDTASSSGAASSGVASVDPAVVAPEPAPVDTIPVDSVPVDSVPVAVDPMPIDTMPIDTMPIDTTPIQPVTITLSDPTPSLEQIWAVDGTVWLLPGYSFRGDDGGTYTVIAVADEFLDTSSTDTGTDPVPMPVETTIGGDTAGGSSAACTSPEPTATVPFNKDGSSLVGLCLADAEALAEANGFTVRVGRQDGADLPVTADYSDTRFTVAVDGGVVSSVIGVG